MKYGVRMLLELEFCNDESKSKRVKINGIYDEDSFVSSGEVYIYNEEIIEVLEQEKIKDLSTKFKGVKVAMLKKYFPKSVTENDSSYIGLYFEKNNKIIKFDYEYHLEYWKNLYSIKEMGIQLKEVCSKINNVKFEENDEEDKEYDSILNGFSLIFEIDDTSKSFSEEISAKLVKVKKIFEMAIDNLNKNSNKLNFEFVVDDYIKVICEQYLLYFIQFLKDLGINAHSEITSEKFKIFFSVIPEDGSVAFEKIRDALDIYLELPKIQNDIVGKDIAILQLQATVSHLNSQLALSKATLLAQEKTIQALELLSTKQLIISDKKNEEDILGGLVKVTEYKKNGIKINLPEILRCLKRKI